MKNNKKRVSKTVRVETNPDPFVLSITKKVITGILSRFAFEQVKPYLDMAVDIEKVIF